MSNFIIKGKGSYDNDYKKPEQAKRNEELRRMSKTLPIEANPDHKHFKQASEDFSKMDKVRDKKDYDQLNEHVRSLATRNVNN